MLSSVSERYEQPDLEKARQIQTSHLEFAVLWEVSTGSAKFRRVAAVRTSFLCTHVSSAASIPCSTCGNSSCADEEGSFLEQDFCRIQLLVPWLVSAQQLMSSCLSTYPVPFIFTLLMHRTIWVVQ